MSINHQRLIDSFCKLVQIDSVSAEEEAIADFLVNFLEKKVDLAKKDSFGNVYAKVEGQGEPIFLAAHMDTVEPGRGIKPIIKDDYIQSDGKSILGGDNKIAIACILEVTQALKEANSPHRPFELIFTRFEEADASGGLNFDYSLLTATKGYCFDYCSPLGGIITSSPLNERCDIKLIGEGSHSTQPEKSINVLEPLGEFLSQVKIGRRNDVLFNIGLIEAGHARNSVPGEANIKAEIRSHSEKSLKKQKDFLHKVLKKIATRHKIRFKVEFVREYSSYTHQNNKAKLFIEETIQKMELSNIKPKLVDDWAISDANTFNNKGLICLNLSDGGENPHTTKEKVKIQELVKLTNLMLAIVS